MIHLRGLAIDRKANEAKAPFARAKRIEAYYAAKLRSVARHVGDLVAGFDVENLEGNVFVQTALTEYGRLLEPWAGSVAWRMIRETAARDEQNWASVAVKMGRALRKEIEGAPTGAAMRRLLAEQVALITSLPTEAAVRVRELTQEGLIQGTRPGEIAARIMETGEVTRSRATLIARTETARTAATLTQVRAQHIGVTHYTWVTAGDSNVRPSHRALNRKTFRYDDPPICDAPDIRGNPGTTWNCRCYGAPLIPD